MKRVLLIATCVLVGVFLATFTPIRTFAQAIIPPFVVKDVRCRVDYYQNITPWEEVIAGGNLNTLYILKTTEQLPSGLYQTGVAVCWDNSQYNWNYTYR